MSDLPRLNSPRSHTMPMNAALDVRQRLQELRTWQAEWQHDEALLGKRLDQLDETSPFYAQQAMQIASLRRRLSMDWSRSPIDISPKVIQQTGYGQLRVNLAQQFAALSREERVLWLNDFYFILTPDLRQLNDKMSKVRPTVRSDNSVTFCWAASPAWAKPRI